MIGTVSTPTAMLRQFSLHSRHCHSVMSSSVATIIEIHDISRYIDL